MKSYRPVCKRELMPAYMTAEYWQRYAERWRKNWAKFKRLYPSFDAWLAVHPGEVCGRAISNGNGHGPIQTAAPNSPQGRR